MYRVLSTTLLILMLSELGLAQGTTKGTSLQGKATFADRIARCALLTSDQRIHLADSLRQLPDNGSDMGRLSIRSSEISETLIQEMPLGDSTVLVVLEHLDTPHSDGYIRVYTGSWEPLPELGRLINEPKAELLKHIKRGASLAHTRLMQLLSPLYVQMKLSEQGILSVQAAPRLSEEDRQDAELLALIAGLPTLTYSWNQGQFVSHQ